MKSTTDILDGLGVNSVGFVDLQPSHDRSRALIPAFGTLDHPQKPNARHIRHGEAEVMTWDKFRGADNTSGNSS
jgi:hypothetical protein